MRNIALLVETSLASGRQILSGISRFIHERDDWTIFHQTGPLGALNPEALRTWSGDGIIARIANRRIWRIVSEKRVPVVDVLGNVPDSRFPTVTCDEAAISGLVAEHFVSRGFRHFAFFGLENEGWSMKRRTGFFAAVAEVPDATSSALMIRHDEKSRVTWEHYVSRICGWVERLPKPVGMMVSSDQFGPDVLEACRRLRLMIPEDVALVAVDNDPCFCEVCVPRLSSVEPNHELVGYEAASLLDRLLADGPRPDEPVLIPPLRLELRRSSDTTALGDANLAKAMNLIRDQACSGLSVDEVARAAGLSRSVLQRRFISILGDTVHETITRIRLARARELLSNTTLPLADVAERSGFTHQEYLGYVFRRRLGLTPADYRRKMHRLTDSHPNRIRPLL